MAKKCGSPVDLGDIYQHSWPESYPIEGQTVSPHRSFGFGTARQIIPRSLSQVPAGSLYYFFIRHEL
tara:strand:- start:292 stop:492 length:201 start_codon:yes stop_codon:yes gene_type:complete